MCTISHAQHDILSSLISRRLLPFPAPFTVTLEVVLFHENLSFCWRIMFLTLMSCFRKLSKSEPWSLWKKINYKTQKASKIAWNIPLLRSYPVSWLFCCCSGQCWEFWCLRKIGSNIFSHQWATPEQFCWPFKLKTKRLFFNIEQA